MKRQLRRINLPVICINTGKEYEEFNPQYRSLSDSFKDVSCCCIILDDWVKDKEGDLKTLIKLLGFLKRHKSCYIFLNTYMISNTGASSLLNLFDFIVFTKHAANWRSLKTITRLYPIEDLDDSMIKKFLSGDYRYLKVDTKNQKFTRLSDNCEEEEVNRFDKSSNVINMREISERMREIIKHFDEPEILISALNFIQRNVNLEEILDANDFSIILAGTNKTIKVSLLDFLLSLRSRNAPSYKVKALFRYLTSKMLFPECFVSNKDMLKLLTR